MIAFNLSNSSDVISPFASLLFRSSMGSDFSAVATGAWDTGTTTETGTTVAAGDAATALA